MNEKQNTPQAILDQISDLKQLAEKAKVKLTPEIEKLIRDSVERIQIKLASKEPVTKDDLAFIEEANGMIETEKWRQIEIPRQYGARLETLATFDIIKSLNKPSIVGIDGNKYTAPTLKQIVAKITPERVKLINNHIKEPLLLVVPFAMPLKMITKKVEKNKGKLKQNPACTKFWDIESDLPDRSKDEERIVYFPEYYFQHNSYSGHSKSDILKRQDRPNAFPGWQVIVVDGTDNVPEDTLDKPVHQLRSEFDQLGLSGLTPEDWLTLHAEGVLRGKPYDDSREGGQCRNLASYLPLTNFVPASLWDSDSSALRAHLYLDSPAYSAEYLGARRAVRIY